MEKNSISKFFFLVLGVFIALIFWLFWAYFSSIILACLLASAFYPLYTWLFNRLKGRAHIAAIIMTLLITLVLLIPVGDL